MTKINFNGNKDSENPVVYIRAFIEDDDRGYGTFDLVTNLDLVKQTAKSCKESMALDDSFVEKTYDEVLLKRFRPRTNNDEFCMSVIKYICNYLKEDINKLTTKRNRIVVHINVENDDWSEIAIMPLDYVEKFREIDARNDYVGSEDVKLDFVSKLGFVGFNELVILYHLVRSSESTPDHICRLTNSELLDQMSNANGRNETEENSKEPISTILNSLSFYRFIDINYKGNGDEIPFSREITVCDWDITKAYFNELSRASA